MHRDTTTKDAHWLHNTFLTGLVLLILQGPPTWEGKYACGMISQPVNVLFYTYPLLLLSNYYIFHTVRWTFPKRWGKSVTPPLLHRHISKSNQANAFSPSYIVLSFNLFDHCCNLFFCLSVYFPCLKMCILWSGVSYSAKIMCMPFIIFYY